MSMKFMLLQPTSKNIESLMNPHVLSAALLLTVCTIIGSEIGCTIAGRADVDFNYSPEKSNANSDSKQQGYYSWDLTYRYSTITSGRQRRRIAELTDGEKIDQDNISQTLKMAMGDEYMGHVQMMIRRDRQRHVSRGLLETGANASYSLAPANETTLYDNMGGLHYTYVTLGSPGKSFLVALDTGSDLLWVPCECQQCATTDWTNYLGQSAEGMEFAVYSPSESNSSQIVMCDDEMCPSIVSNCTTNTNSECTYVVNYMATGTSTAGVIVEDLLHLNIEANGAVNGSNTTVGGGGTTPIYFGCAKQQTGDLLDGVAPDGLLGLGPNEVSVPNTLARNAIASNSFSLCFSALDTSGRLVFGTQSVAGVPNTPLVQSNIYYIVKPSEMTVGGDSSLSTSENLIFDTGTSYTTLPNSIFSKLGALFDQKIALQTYSASNQLFSYCWIVSNSNDLASLPSMSITFSGGSIWEITDPYEYLYDRNGNIGAACLAILNGSSTGIIGYNFMPGYEYFLNQEYMTFGWAPSDCYNLNQSTVGTRQTSITSKISDTNASPPSISSKQQLWFTQFWMFSLLLLTTFSLI